MQADRQVSCLQSDPYRPVVPRFALIGEPFRAELDTDFTPILPRIEMRAYYCEGCIRRPCYEHRGVVHWHRARWMLKNSSNE